MSIKKKVIKTFPHRLQHQSGLFGIGFCNSRFTSINYRSTSDLILDQPGFHGLTNHYHSMHQGSLAERATEELTRYIS